MRLIEKPIDSIGVPPGFEGDLFIIRYYGNVAMQPGAIWQPSGAVKYATVQCYQDGPEPMIVPGLAVLPSENQAKRFMEHVGNAVDGEIKLVQYDEAKEIALSKHFKALALVEDADPKKVMVQWVN